MRPGLRTAAMLMRARLKSGGVFPQELRSTLDGIPKEDRDAWLDLVLDTEEVPADEPGIPRGCVPYLPCSVSSVLDAIELAEVSSDDVFVDVGAGVGRASLLTHLLTGADCVGIEVQASLVEMAIERAASLSLNRMRFIHGDAVDRIGSITGGTVFFLYCPFSGNRIERFLDGLEGIARIRRVRVCCVDMPPLERPWLTRLPSTSSDLDVYRSNDAAWS